MEADSTEQQSVIQEAAASKWAAANAKMREVMAWIRNRSSENAVANTRARANIKVNGDYTVKQSVTLDSEKKDESLATAQVCDSQPMDDQYVSKTGKQTIKDAGLYPVAMGEFSTECSSIKGTGQNKQICSRLTQKQDKDSVFPGL